MTQPFPTPLPVSATAADLPALVASRICHDLISPLGAIGNGLELLSMTGAGGSPEMDLITESAASAAARVRFFRIAFGAAGSGVTVRRAEIDDVLSGHSAGGRIAVTWSGGDCPRDALRLLLLLALCAETALPTGGQIALGPNGDGWQVEIAAAQRFEPDPALWSALTGTGTAEIRPATIQFALAPLAARDAGLRLMVDLAGRVIRAVR